MAIREPKEKNFYSMTMSRIIVVFLVLTFPIVGLADGIHSDSETASGLMHTFVIAVCMYAWCGHHAQEKGIEPPPLAHLLCFFLVPVGVTLYLFKKFGFKQGGAKFLVGIAMSLVAFGLYSLAFYGANQFI